MTGATAFTCTPPATFTGDIAVNGGDLTSTAATFNLLNATVTTLNLGGAATTIAIGAAGCVWTQNGTHTLTGGTVTTSIPVISATQTWNQVATAFTGWKLNITNTTSLSSSLLIDLQVDSTSQFSVNRLGEATATTCRAKGANSTTFAQNIYMEYDTTGNIAAIVAEGPNATTKPAFNIRLHESDGGTEIIPIAISTTGVITLANLTGTGSRTVVADANGVLSAP